MAVGRRQIASGLVDFSVAMESVTIGTGRLILGAGATAPSSSSCSSSRVVHFPGSIPALGYWKTMSVIRCQAQKNKKSPSSGGGFGAKTVTKPSKW